MTADLAETRPGSDSVQFLCDFVIICDVVVLSLMNRVSQTNHVEFLLMKGLYKHLSYKI